MGPEGPETLLDFYEFKHKLLSAGDTESEIRSAFQLLAEPNLSGRLSMFGADEELNNNNLEVSTARGSQTKQHVDVKNGNRDGDSLDESKMLFISVKDIYDEAKGKAQCSRQDVHITAESLLMACENMLPSGSPDSFYDDGWTGTHTHIQKDTKLYRQVGILSHGATIPLRTRTRAWSATVAAVAALGRSGVLTNV